MLKLKLHWQILIALFAAVAAGLTVSKIGGGTEQIAVDVFDFVGTLFLNALKMLIVPLIVSSIIIGIANLGSDGRLGKLGSKTIAYYLATSTLAILLGLFLVNLIQPGIDADGNSVKDQLGLSVDTDSVVEKVEGRGTSDVVGVFLRMVPVNIVDAAAQGQMLGLIFFGILFGFFMTRIDPESSSVLHRFWNGVFEVMMRITDLLMRLAPIGVFALVAKVVATTGFAAFVPLGLFALTVILALALHFGVTLPLILKYVARVSPLRMYRAMAPAILTAFSTSSSSATLPVTMECVEENAKVSKSTSSFVLPLGATVNMDGTALYECVAAMFIAQAYGLELSFTQQFLIVSVALITSIGVAGIPAASLVAIAIILGVIGLPAEAVGLILAVDRILDMCRTSVNVFSDSCGAVVIGRLQGEKDILREPTT